ncbi:MAG: hypothetical protein C4296_13375 [Gemmataceae bacterium]
MIQKSFNKMKKLSEPKNMAHKGCTAFQSALIVTFVAACVAAGCDQSLFRPQSQEEEVLAEKLETAKVKTIGDVTSFMGVQRVRAYGVGVVRGLQGTGSDPQPDEYRRMALRLLKEMGIEDPAKFLASPDTAVVIVSAELPPGIQKGDPVDVEVEVPPRDKTTSLRGGYLMRCDLREYADARQLTGEGPSRMLRGRVLVRAEGPILTGLGDTSDEQKLRRGRVWNGGKAVIDRYLTLVLPSDAPKTQSRVVAERINELFHGPYRGVMRGVAEAKTPQIVWLRIPHQYEQNLPRFLRVVRQIPLSETGASRRKYRKELAVQLLNPALAVPAAIKLEALGSESVEDLRPALQHEHPLVRFCAAEALAYLGDAACAEVLATTAKNEPRLRAYALAALASLNEAICHIKLRELLESDSAQTRYGAFRALFTLDPRDPALAGQKLTDFYLHRVAPESSPLIHFSTYRRAEIVLFGEEAKLIPPFSLQAGPEFVLSSSAQSDTCFITRVTRHGRTDRRTCSLALSDILTTMGEMGASYPDAVDLLQRAARYRVVSAPVVADAVPQAPSVYEIALGGVVDILREKQKNQSESAGEDSETVDLGSTPTLFAPPGRK